MLGKNGITFKKLWNELNSTIFTPPLRAENTNIYCKYS